MLGAIIGDIIGSRFEFNNTNNYDFNLFDDRCSYTDDTICTIAIADAILKGITYKDSLIKWCREYPDPMGAYGGSFNRWIWQDDPQPYNSFGNGAAMRVSPVAWAFGTEDSFDEVAPVIRQAIETAKVSHDHTEGIIGAMAVAVGIFFTRTDNLITKEGKRTLESIASYYYGNEWDFIQRLPRKNYFDDTCQGCVPLAFYITTHSDSFEDAIRKAVSYGGDSDTVGAIVGSLAEPLFGIPKEIEQKALTYLPADMLAVVKEFKDKYH